MTRTKIMLNLKRSGTLFHPIFTTVPILLLISLLAGCGAPATTTQAPTPSAPPITTEAPAKPQGELVASFTNFGSENFLPWKQDEGSAQLGYLVYDYLAYYDVVNKAFLPGLAERWVVSPDAMTLTYYLRKGVQFSDGWGELTSADVKFYFETQARADSVGKPSQARSIDNMDVIDSYTLMLHFKKPYPTFLGQFSPGEGGQGQGIACKKYIETVGEEIASQKPIGTGPYRLVESKTASYYKFEALDSHWRVVPEFKTLTVRNISEVSTIVSALKNKEIDLAQIPAEQMAGLKASGLATEVNSSGGSITNITWGGLAIPEDSRYDPAYHNKDPWVDSKVRKAMAISIDRQAICNTIFSGGGVPAGVPLFGKNMEKYQYPYDPVAAKQLLAEAGYPNGFSFQFMSYLQPGVPETPRVVEAIAGYWQNIGLDPKITVIEYTSYVSVRNKLKTAGTVAFARLSLTSDMLDRCALFLMPNASTIFFMDEGSYVIWKEGNTKVNADERAAYVEKLNQYYYDNVGPIPLCVIGSCYAWNPDKISPFPHPTSSIPSYLDYVRHTQPLNTFRLFTPWPGR